MHSIDAGDNSNSANNSNDYCISPALSWLPCFLCTPGVRCQDFSQSSERRKKPGEVKKTPSSRVNGEVANWSVTPNLYGSCLKGWWRWTLAPVWYWLSSDQGIFFRCLKVSILKIHHDTYIYSMHCVLNTVDLAIHDSSTLNIICRRPLVWTEQMHQGQQMKNRNSLWSSIPLSWNQVTRPPKRSGEITVKLTKGQF